ncbi:hypothetical protein PF005_g29567 [Phytophthora fragariae]|uniref:Uncharacterized protein n=1 Tax=Phytophthora fragariae TaxID=53985 RepID=A0A6A3DFK1_9STRA|nr:hypothetical protein PF003_g14175 [Phytophthora fragariae]KAE8919735.1 hypothetical protein PF009_g29963 [Phytophthora fragariae]KAE8968906.1 hypothetical protein PF011_g27011 [Phytophthora fragariae]KAE9067325.1 hypothetical protein PF007_g28115 [Phytophthora fragariae]KAE9072233.1 hypothetical protein PF006_g28976 [Phytophthora fragariae]
MAHGIGFLFTAALSTRRGSSRDFCLSTGLANRGMYRWTINLDSMYCRASCKSSTSSEVEMS